uniref:Uncharacterized protein MANES_17G014600 n=1 Tax=Rhizophora mucronata TaxID=61149 RepID=A0A2P2JTI8_RHIMU
MALVFTPSSSLLLAKTHNRRPLFLIPRTTAQPFFPFSRNPHKFLRLPTHSNPTTRRPPRLLFASSSESTPEPDPTPNPIPSARNSGGNAGPGGVTDEWGEKADPEAESPIASDSDPPKDEDEWEGGYAASGNGSAAAQGAGAVVEKDAKIEELKRCLVDTVYGTDFGFRASPEVRAEVSELVNQLEAANPTRAPVDAKDLLDGNWVLLYTAFSELLPLLAVGTLPLLKIEKITQGINISNASIVNMITFSSPFATSSFSATATFEVRSPSRVQVEFKEGTLPPPEIKSSIELPENVNLFGQNISLSPVQQALNPLQEAVANISRTISGQSPLKVPIPGDRSRSWLLITYLDEDLRISRGDGGLFVLARQGSPLLDQ